MVRLRQRPDRHPCRNRTRPHQTAPDHQTARDPTLLHRTVLPYHGSKPTRRGIVDPVITTPSPGPRRHDPVRAAHRRRRPARAAHPRRRPPAARAPSRRTPVLRPRRAACARARSRCTRSGGFTAILAWVVTPGVLPLLAVINIGLAIWRVVAMVDATRSTPRPEAGVRRRCCRRPSCSSSCRSSGSARRSPRPTTFLDSTFANGPEETAGTRTTRRRPAGRTPPTSRRRPTRPSRPSPDPVRHDRADRDAPPADVRDRRPARPQRLGPVDPAGRRAVGQRRPLRPAPARLRRRPRSVEPADGRDAPGRDRRRHRQGRDDRPAAQPRERAVPAGPARDAVTCGCFKDLLNALYVEATVRHPDRWPGTGAVAGIGAVRAVVSELTGRPVDAVLVADLWGMIKVVDAMGGIDVYVPDSVYDKRYPDPVYGKMELYIPKGQHHFDGRMALAYARSRHQDSDYGRMARQQTLLLAIRDQIGAKTILNAPDLFAAAKGFTWTDLPRDSLPNLVTLFGKAAARLGQAAPHRAAEVPGLAHALGDHPDPERDRRDARRPAAADAHALDRPIAVAPPTAGPRKRPWSHRSPARPSRRRRRPRCPSRRQRQSPAPERAARTVDSASHFSARDAPVGRPAIGSGRHFRSCERDGPTGGLACDPPPRDAGGSTPARFGGAIRAALRGSDAAPAPIRSVRQLAILAAQRRPFR